jgi:hypothetical protein
MSFFSLSLLGILLSQNAWAEDCSSDAYEPNNTHSEAPLLNSGESISAQACLFDDDYFAITLEADSVVTVETTSIIPTGDLDLYLLSIDGSTELAHSLGDTSNESIIDFYIPEAGTYYIKTSLYSDLSLSTSGASYDLTLNITEAQACEIDIYEENDSWNNTTVITVANGTSLDDLTICPEDEDWFSFELLEHEQLTVTVDFDNDNGDLDINLKDINNNTLASSNTIEDQEVVVYLPESPGAYKLQVKLFTENDAQLGNSYSLQMQTQIINPCGEDEYDPNESMESAQALLEKTYDLVSCDADWFIISATEGKDISISLDFIHLSGDMDLTLYDRDGDPLASSATSNDNEELSFTAPYTGEYYIKVSLVSTLEEGNPYTLTYEQVEPIVDPSSEPTSEPTFEPATEPSTEPTSCQTINLIELSTWLLCMPLFIVFTRKR